MPKNAALTVRLPAALKARLEARAEAEHRSHSAQLVAELEELTDEPIEKAGGEGRFLGLYAGTTVPSDADLAEARARLWGRFPRSDGPDTVVVTSALRALLPPRRQPRQHGVRDDVRS